MSLCWKSGIAKALRHDFRRGGYAAYRVRGIDFNELFENIDRQFPRRFVRWRHGLRVHGDGKYQDKKKGPAIVDSNCTERSSTKNCAKKYSAKR